MRWVFGVSLIAGMLGMIAWAMTSGKRANASGPPAGIRGQQMIAIAVAFGMGGLSASYAGWSIWLAAVAAVAAASLAAWFAGTRVSGDGHGRT
jgi:hypothetical protein